MSTLIEKKPEIKTGKMSWQQAQALMARYRKILGSSNVPPVPVSQGEVITEFQLPLPFDSGIAPSNTEIPGDSFFYETSCTDPQTGEMNVSAIAGKWFGRNYGNGINPNTSSASFASLDNLVRLGRPYGQDLKVSVKTTISYVADSPDKLFYVERGNEDVDEASVRLFINSTGCALDDQGNEVGILGLQMMDLIKVMKKRGQPDLINADLANQTNTCSFILPAGRSRFKCVSYLFAQAHIINDNVVNPVDVNDTGTYGIALLDLRNIVIDRSHPILRDPLGAWEKQPFGGIIISNFVSIATI